MYKHLPSTSLFAVSFADLTLSSIISLPSIAPNIATFFNFYSNMKSQHYTHCMNDTKNYTNTKCGRKAMLLLL